MLRPFFDSADRIGVLRGHCLSFDFRCLFVAFQDFYTDAGGLVGRPRQLPGSALQRANSGHP